MNEKFDIFEMIAIKIKTLRFKHKWTQEELSEKSGISINSISNIENMKEDIKLSTLIALASAFNIPLVQFFNIED